MGKLFGGGGSTTTTTTPTPETRMPDEEDPSIKEARRKAAVDAQARSGRAATVLTSAASRASRASSGAGTTSYTNSLLGQAG
jgi:hypothetical protein